MNKSDPMRYHAFCNGDLVAVVEKNNCNRWILRWPRRGWCMERTANPDTAKAWVEQIFYGKPITWTEHKIVNLDDTSPHGNVGNLTLSL